MHCQIGTDRRRANGYAPAGGKTRRAKPREVKRCMGMKKRASPGLLSMRNEGTVVEM